jgi:hypothetical protein
MNTPINSRDIALRSTEPRVLQISENYIALSASSLQFKYGTDNLPQPAQVIVTASLVGKLEGTVVFTTSGFTQAPSVDPTNPNRLVIDPSKFVSDFATINASVNWQGSNYQATPVTITRVLNQLLAKVQRSIDLVPSYNDGSGYTLPADDNFVELYNGVVKITEGITYGPASQTANGLTVSVNSSTGKITLTQAAPNTWTGNNNNFTLTATRNNIVYNTTYNITKAKAGAGGIQTQELYLYIWSVGTPAVPSGSSVYTWTTNTHVYNGGDQWALSPSTNPGNVGIVLWKAAKNIIAEASVVTTQISTNWAGASIRAVTTEANEVIKTKTVTVYQNSPSIPGISGTSTLTWSNGSYTAPTNWSITAPARAAGQVLYSAEVFVQQATSQPTSNIDWTQASIRPISYYGTDGAAARRAYVLAISAPAGSPATYVATGDTLPVAGTWFSGKTWSSTAPTVIAEGETLYQTDGVYVSAGNTTWGYPYISSLKVGNLQAISANTGTLTITGALKGGDATNLTTGTGFYVDNNGHLRVGTPGGAQLKFDAGGLSITNSAGSNVFTVISQAETAATNAARDAGTAATNAGTAATNAGTAATNAGNSATAASNAANSATIIKVQYSADNSNWHDSYIAGDIYIRTGSKTVAAADFTYSAGSRYVGTNGRDGDPGVRGSLIGYGKQYGIYSEQWDNLKANRVIYNMVNGETFAGDLSLTSHLRIGDTVTLTNGASATKSYTRYWTGSWTDPSVVINGDLIVTGTIGADKLAVGGILVGQQIKNQAGTFVIDFGSSPYISISV